MRPTRSAVTRSTAVIAALALTLLTGSPAMASGSTLLRDGFRGSFPSDHPLATPVIAGVAPGGAPWVLDERSRVRVREDGRITASIRRLVIPGRDPVVRMVAATLVCDGAVADSTEPFALDMRGSGYVTGHVDVPADCDDPVVLIRNASTGTPGAYFAFTTHH